MLLKLLLLRVTLVATVPTLPTVPSAPPPSAPSDMPSATSRAIFSVSAIFIPSFLSKPASSTIRTPLPPATQPLSTVIKSSVTKRTPMPSRASTTLVSKLHASPLPTASTSPGGSKSSRHSSLTRESPPASASQRPVDRVPTPHIAFPTKPLIYANRKPPPVAKLSQYLKEPSVFGPDSSDIDFQQHTEERGFRRLPAQHGNSKQQDELLLEQLKRVLQQNNEDYLERTRPEIDDGRRRMLHGRDRKRRRHHERTRSNEQDKWEGGGVTPLGVDLTHNAHIAHTAARRADSWERVTTSQLTVSLLPGDPAVTAASYPASDPSVREDDKHTKQKKARSNLKRFMEFVKKNRALLKAFIKEKKSGHWAHGPRQQGERLGRQGARPVPRTRSEAFLRGLMGEVLKSTRLMVPVQLDLSPGRGELIEEMRVKGRICQRNVMKPEGPKYDSHGKTYQPEFIASPRLRYDVTKKKTFILPICCNCCKKSVLGCE